MSRPAGGLARLRAGLRTRVLALWGRRRLRAVDAELPEFLDLLSGALQAGYGLLPALTLAAEQAEPGLPVLGPELRRTLQAIRLGMPLAGALGELAARLRHPDLTMALTAIQLAHELGGNLSGVLRVVRETVLARQRLSRQVQVLTAQARLSGWVIGLLPPALLLLMRLMNPEFTAVLWTEPIGRLLLGLAALLTLLGALVIRWLLREAVAP